MECRGSRMLVLMISFVWLLVVPALLQGQTDRGAITGTVLDPAGAAIPNAKVTATRQETGALSETTTTATGNYTFPSLEVGTYDLKFSANGFETSVANGIVVETVQIVRIDAKLTVGASSQTVVVTSQGPMLQTESVALNQTLTTDRINNLPLSYAGAGIQNPTAFASTQPGATSIIDGNGNYQLQVNGAPIDTYRTLMDGQDITSGIDPTHLSEGTPSQEALQEVTLQVSNFAAEFGQVAGGLFNFTSKSGTNSFHGSAYENWVNEVLNAGDPYTNNGNGGLVRPRDRANDWGFTVGGPVWIPKVYNGKNKTFFFFNYERFATTSTVSGTYATLPTSAYRLGDFSQALTGKQLGTDPLGRPIMENEIYDPLTTRTVNGQVVRDPFPGNVIPSSRIDPVAAKIQALIPATTNGNTINNFLQFNALSTTTTAPSFKVDQNIGIKSKLSFYIGEWTNDVPKNYGDGLPYPISSARNYLTHTWVYRLNLDQTMTPTMLLHIGLGEMRYSHIDSAPNSVLDYNAVTNLGLVGASRSPAPFPDLTGLAGIDGGGVTYPGQAGAITTSLGFSNSGHYLNDNPTAIASLSWVRGNHSFKTGIEWRETVFTDIELAGTGGVYNFASQETGLPYLQLSSLNGGDVGFPYASFLLGTVDSASVNSGQEPNFRKYGVGTYVQDTWKVTPKFTLDYGIRWDYQQSWSESRNRWAEFAPNVANPSAGNLLGATEYQGNGPLRCNCKFTKTYPYGYGPRLGAAYSLDNKTVIRGGWGLIYGSTPGIQYLSGTPIIGTGWNTIPFTATSFGVAPVQLSQGLQYPASELTNASLSPGIVPNPGQVNPPPYYIDPQAGRPARTNQWNIAVQRQLIPNLSVEAAYVGNTAIWLQSDLLDVNGNTAAGLAAHGLDITNAADQALLLSPMNSPQVMAAGFTAPYVGFPMNLTLAQALRPYPQFTAITGKWSPRGDSWYNALQVKLVKRMSYGLDLTAGYTYQSETNLGGISGTSYGSNYNLGLVNDVYTRSTNKAIASNSQPQVFNTAITYVTPALGENRILRTAVRDWTFGAFLRYASGFPIPSPYAQNGLNSILLRSLPTGTGTFFNRVAGQPLFLKSLNCHCINPNTDLTLNPAAWSDPAPGQFSTGPIYYSDYRYQRRPTESVSLGRLVPIREAMSFELRMQFFNVFNRTQMGDPNGTNALQSTVSDNGVLQSGFGWINPSTLYGSPRQGQLTARFRF
jgi:hypothetical protein